MKKFLLLFLAAAIVAGCKKNDGPDATTSTLRIALSYANPAYDTPLDKQKVTIKLTSLLNGSASESRHVPGTAELPSISPGSYDVAASVTFTKGEFLTLTGESIEGESITFNASAKNVDIIRDTELDFSLVSGTVGDFVIKQIYYAGSDNKQGATFRDQFIEIHNNTDRVLYADSLYFGRLVGRQTPAASTNYHYQANGQLDWSKSKDMAMGNEANTEYGYVRDLHMIPGDGKTYPMQPGASIVIAQNALNHKVSYTDSKGKEISVGNPDLTIDLSGADFEAYYGNLTGINPLPSDVDNPVVPNVEVIVRDNRDMIMDNPGRDAFFIFKGKTRSEVDDLPEYYDPKTKEPTGSDKKRKQLPIAWIMDGVDIQPSAASQAIPKRLATVVDAGSTKTTDGAYSSQSVIRKTAKIANGRRILQDSNNSSADFVSIKANPRGFFD